MRFAAKLKGAQRLNSVLQGLARSGEIDTAAREGAEAVRAEALAALGDGLPPGSRSGALAASLNVVRDGPGRYRVATPLAYGWFLEFGSQNRAAYPWLRPAFERRLGAIKQRFATALRALVGQAARQANTKDR